jgi:hypothetical protein
MGRLSIWQPAGFWTHEAESFDIILVATRGLDAVGFGSGQ